MQTQKLELLDQVALFHLDVRTWTGRKKLRPEDIKGDIPPKKLASLGSKRIIDPKKVAVFESIKRRAERLLGSVGIRVMGSYAIPLDKVKEMTDQLCDLRMSYTQEKTNFLFTYKKDVEDWIEEQGEWGAIIRPAITPVADVEAQLHFGWQAYQVTPTGVDNDGLDEEVGGMATQLFSEIARDATRCFEDSFLMKTKVSLRAVGPLRAIEEKLKGLAFLDARAGAIQRFLSEALLSLPQSGSIEGEQLNKLFGVLIVMSDPDKITEHGQMLLDGNAIDDDHLLAISTSSYKTVKESSNKASVEVLAEVPTEAPTEAPAPAPAWF